MTRRTDDVVLGDGSPLTGWLPRREFPPSHRQASDGCPCRRSAQRTRTCIAAAATPRAPASRHSPPSARAHPACRAGRPVPSPAPAPTARCLRSSMARTACTPPAVGSTWILCLLTCRSDAVRRACQPPVPAAHAVCARSGADARICLLTCRRHAHRCGAAAAVGRVPGAAGAGGDGAAGSPRTVTAPFPCCLLCPPFHSRGKGLQAGLGALKLVQQRVELRQRQLWCALAGPAGEARTHVDILRNDAVVNGQLELEKRAAAFAHLAAASRHCTHASHTRRATQPHRQSATPCPPAG